MSFLKKFFNKEEKPIRNYKDFWDWFKKEEHTFFKVVKEHDSIEEKFFDKLAPKLKEIRKGIFFLTGMFNEETVELILTADGNIRNMVFVEEIVNAAPTIKGWKFTAHKPPLDIENVNLRMGKYVFGEENLFFYANNYPEYPDEIDITIVHKNYTKDNRDAIENGSYIFLDNFLGELDFARTIDRLSFISPDEVKEDLIPIEKLKNYLIWRQKEFIEKYEGIRHNTENDEYASLNGTLAKNDTPLLALINTTLLKWDRKASHPWILTIKVVYDGSKNNGLPEPAVYEEMDVFEEDILKELMAADGYLNIGRRTGDGLREVYFACKEFKKSSRVIYDIQQKYLEKFVVEYSFYKDKYWRSFDKFIID